MLWRRGFGVASVVSLIACGGSTGEPCGNGPCEGLSGAGSGGFVGGGGGAGGAGGTIASVPPPEGPFPSPSEGAAACDQPGEVIDVLADPDDVAAWLTRRWVFCTGTPLFQTPHDGVEFAPDQHWYFLDLVGGELVRREGFAGGGDWDTMDAGGDVQVNINRFQGGGLGGFMRFAVSPLKVSMGVGGDGNPPEYVGVSPAPL